MAHHTQCLLTNGQSPQGPFTQVCWIPSQLAVEGKILKIKDNFTGKWSNGWKVTEVYATDFTEAVEDRSQDYKRTRKASDR